MIVRPVGCMMEVLGVLFFLNGAMLPVSFLGAMLPRRDAAKSGALCSSLHTTYDDVVVDLTQVLLPLLCNKMLGWVE